MLGCMWHNYTAFDMENQFYHKFPELEWNPKKCDNDHTKSLCSRWRKILGIARYYLYMAKYTVCIVQFVSAETGYKEGKEYKPMATNLACSYVFEIHDVV